MTKHYEFQKDYPALISYGDLVEWMDREEDFQRSIPATDPRHWEMFEFQRDDEGNEWVDLYWGGPFGYPYDLARIKKPEDLLWLFVHMSEKKWPHFTGARVGELIKQIARKKNWPQHGVAPHQNEAPKPNPNAIGERAKMTSAIRYSVIKRDHYRCRACGFSVADGATLHVDHIIPVSRGGKTERSNLQTLCASCNLGKADQ